MIGLLSIIAKTIKITTIAATMSLGTIYEKNGEVSRTFRLHNEGEEAVALVQTFPSCGCTSIYPHLENDSIMPGDSIAVEVRFNPQNKGGKFYETATLVFASSTTKASTVLILEGNCITSEETLLKQYPIRKKGVRLTKDRIDLGEMQRGKSKTVYLGILHQRDSIWKESVPLEITADEHMGWGEQHLKKTITTVSDDDGLYHDVDIDLSMVVLPNFSIAGKAPQPQLQTNRRLKAGEKKISIINSGQATLIIYRAYASEGVDLLKKPLQIAQGKQKAVKIPAVKKSASQPISRITLITNDPHRSRFVIRRQ